MRSGNAPLILAAAAHVLAWVALMFLLFWPWFYQGVSESASVDGSPGETVRMSASLIAVNGWGVVRVLLVPVVISGIGLLATVTNRLSARANKVMLWLAAILTLLFCLVGAFSVGLFYLPAALVLIVAAILSTRRGSAA